MCDVAADKHIGFIGKKRTWSHILWDVREYRVLMFLKHVFTIPLRHQIDPQCGKECSVRFQWKNIGTAKTTSGWWFGTVEFLTFHSVGNFIIPTDEVIFFRGVGQPPTSHMFSHSQWSKSKKQWPFGNQCTFHPRSDAVNSLRKN